MASLLSSQQPPFDPSTWEIEGWLGVLEARFRSIPDASDSQKVGYLLANLGPKAQIVSGRIGDPNITWDQAKRVVLDQFSPAVAVADAAIKLRNLSLKTLSVDDFVIKAQSLAKLLNPNATQEQLDQQTWFNLLAELPPNIRMLISVQPLDPSFPERVRKIKVLMSVAQTEDTKPMINAIVPKNEHPNATTPKDEHKQPHTTPSLKPSPHTTYPQPQHSDQAEHEHIVSAVTSGHNNQAPKQPYVQIHYDRYPGYPHIQQQPHYTYQEHTQGNARPSNYDRYPGYSPMPHQSRNSYQGHTRNNIRPSNITHARQPLMNQNPSLMGTRTQGYPPRRTPIQCYRCRGFGHTSRECATPALYRQDF